MESKYWVFIVFIYHRGTELGKVMVLVTVILDTQGNRVNPAQKIITSPIATILR